MTHEGTLEVRGEMKNSLIQEYKTLWMQQGEKNGDVQKRFPHIKILKSLNITWQPKVTKIFESKDFTSITHAGLFGKLREYKIKMPRMAKKEAKEKKSRGLTLKSST